ncbi:MAG: hypothetical protein IT436_09845 [Phycisphaerales bacterium]|nr:hypothetical protein [Phycisphaerales bacterium]
MNATYRMLLIVAAMLAWFVPTAHARWYDPTTGRWLQRDPLGTQHLWMHQAASITTHPKLDMDGPVNMDLTDPAVQYADGMNLYQYVGSDPLARTDPPGLGPVEWLLTGDWDPDPDTLDAAKCGYLRGFGMNPFDTSQSLGQWAYTGDGSASQPVLKGAVCAATDVADCWKSCMADLNIQLAKAAAAAAGVGGVGMAPIVPKEGAAKAAQRIGWDQLARRIRWDAARAGASQRTTIARCTSLAMKESGLSKGAIGSRVKGAFRGLANLAKGRGVGGAVKGGVAGVAWIEAGMSMYCGAKCYGQTP